MGSYRFEEFRLDPHDRLLCRGDVPVELNARYLDALTLLVSEQGRLVSKDRFLEEVWRGVPVTDEALTQCIKTLRRQLGDDASRPRFIETVPKHGYRFIAPVEGCADADGAGPRSSLAARDDKRGFTWLDFLLLGGAAMVGGGVAGVLGGLFYGFAGASQPLEPGMGAVSVLLVLLSVTVVVALLGAAGVGFGIAAAAFARRRDWHWPVLGGAAGGLIVGAVVKLLSVDAFNLLFGRSPGDVTGAGEGALLGAAVGFGAWLGRRGREAPPLRRTMLAAGAAGAVAGIAITLLGGRLLGGSLHLLSRNFPGSRLRLEQIGSLFGENGFGPVTQLITGAMEGLLFGSFVVGAMILAGRSLGSQRGAVGPPR